MGMQWTGLLLHGVMRKDCAPAGTAKDLLGAWLNAGALGNCTLLEMQDATKKIQRWFAYERRFAGRGSSPDN
eukprot:1151365-Pelagomonas_calceolata.AAC.6